MLLLLLAAIVVVGRVVLVGSRLRVVGLVLVGGSRLVVADWGQRHRLDWAHVLAVLLRLLLIRAVVVLLLLLLLSVWAVSLGRVLSHWGTTGAATAGGLAVVSAGALVSRACSIGFRTALLRCWWVASVASVAVHSVTAIDDRPHCVRVVGPVWVARWLPVAVVVSTSGARIVTQGLAVLVPVGARRVVAARLNNDQNAHDGQSGACQNLV